MAMLIRCLVPNANDRSMSFREDFFTFGSIQLSTVWYGVGAWMGMGMISSLLKLDLSVRPWVSISAAVVSQIILQSVMVPKQMLVPAKGAAVLVLVVNLITGTLVFTTTPWIIDTIIRPLIK